MLIKPVVKPSWLLCLPLALSLLACGDSPDTVPHIQLESTTLAHRVQADGELFAVNSVSINAPRNTRGPRFIAEVVAEYSEVTPGDLVIRFDATQLSRSQREADNALRTVQANTQFKNAEQSAEMTSIGLDQRLVVQEFSFADRFSIDDIQIRSQLEILDSMQNKEFLADKKAYLNWQESSFASRSQGELDLLQLQLGQQQNLLEQAESGLAALEIRAPHNGILLLETNRRGEKPEVGGMVFPGERIGSIPDLSLQHVRLHIIEQEAIGLAPGQRVEFSLSARPSERLSGEVLTVGQVAQSRERRDPRRYIEVIVAPTEQLPHFLPGAKLRAEIFAAEKQQVISIPVQAIFNEQQQLFVWKRQGRSYEKQPVTIGEKSLTHAEVLSGLKAGDIIALVAVGD